jgi:F0F1-type ATP synthase membrane subunit b/b'
MELPPLWASVLFLAFLYVMAVMREILAATVRSRKNIEDRLGQSREDLKKSAEEFRAWRQDFQREMDELKQRREENRQLVQEQAQRSEENLRLQKEQLAVLKSVAAALGAETKTRPRAKPVAKGGTPSENS